MLFDLCDWLVELFAKWLSWASQKQVKAAKREIKNRKAAQTAIEKAKDKLQNEYNKHQDHIEFLEEFVNQTPKEL